MVESFSDLLVDPEAYVLSLLVLALLAMIIYDIHLFFKMKVYKTYSTSSILVGCITLLTFRVAGSILYIL